MTLLDKNDRDRDRLLAALLLDHQQAGVRVELPGEPKGKGRPRARVASRGGGQQYVQVYQDAQTRSYEGMLRLAGAQAMGGRAPLRGALRALVIATFSVPQSWSGKRRKAALGGYLWPTGRPDADNLLKTVDALTGVVWLDDAQVVECVVTKHYGEKPALLVLVTEIKGALL
jgi:Holliday junction resolvase RusA-like endonuclease